MSQERFYHPELDLLRLLAFLFIFFDHGSGAFHSHFIQAFAEASRVGLPLFFILSSYLISELLLREHENTGTIHIRAFYVRRILRIWPLYFTFLAVIYVAGLLGHGYFPASALFAFSALLGSWYSYSHGFLLFGVGILWSISVEEQFYLLWPFLVRAGASRAMKSSIPALLLVSVVTLLYSGATGVPPDRVWFNSFYQFGYFAIGAALALWMRARPFMPSMARRCFYFAIAAGCFLLMVYITSFLESSGRYLITALMIAFALLLGVTSTFLFLGCFNLHLSEQSVFVKLGKISYGLYVFHLLALQVCEVGFRHIHIGERLRPFLQLGFALALTCVLAQLSYKFLEAPFLRMKQGFTFVPSRNA